jgi:DNA repair exonuclease SbcCD ATPase subunit
VFDGLDGVEALKVNDDWLAEDGFDEKFARFGADLKLVVLTPAQEGLAPESEVERMSKVLKDCEAALEMANNEIDKANKVACDAKAKVVELDARIYQIEEELKDAMDRAAGLESELKTYRAKYADAKSTLGEKEVPEVEEDVEAPSLESLYCY